MTTDPEQSAARVAHDYQIGADGLLAVRLFSGSAQLRGVPGDRVRIHTGDGAPIDGLRFEPAAGSLSIKARSGISLSIGRTRQARGTPLAIDVPMAATVVVETASGDVESVGLHGDQRYRTLSGQVRLEQADGTITIDSVSGDVFIDAPHDLDATVRTVSGDIALTAGTFRAMQVTTTSGDTRISGRLAGAERYSVQSVSGDALVATDSGLWVEARTVAGRVRSEVVPTIEERDGRAMIIAGGGSILAFRSMSGDLRVVPAHVATPLVLEPPATEPPSPGTDAPHFRILRDLELGLIDVAEADRRLTAFGPDNGPADGIDLDAPR